ncbi:MAG: 50S ribosomal protein L19 [Candidatus Curtissbacteria bacterium GW2011_GWA1_40_9]|uniref:50S ribosomal protein L19 n=1 Tax=Candidatus Curtissbacteria bacterium GW2011_GWA1_40_9 TaxID=1618408 RepID=A0A0G0W1C5_9BACT|nr:MAG: 50S ribosomal protein L19 [Candidatus Curtissbacteria bacterium GW2011_GWA1_40_9]
MDKASFKVGDVVKVITKDAQEKKIHASLFEGVVISLRGKSGDKTFTVRKKGADGIFVERIFPLDSPIIEKISVTKANNTRRAKLYYLRNNKAK